MTDNAGQAAGMPQLELSTFPNQIFWLVVTLVVLYLILSRVALPRIEAVLADRRGTITNDIAAAEEFKQKAAEAEQAYHAALAAARAEAGQIIDAAKAEIQGELDDRIARAEAEIAARSAESEARIRAIRDQAVEMIGVVARDTTHEVLTVFDVSADASRVDAAVSNRMNEQGGAA